MPSLVLFHTSYHLATDAMPFLGMFLLVPSFLLLVFYSVFLAIYLSVPPSSCTGSPLAMRNSVVWGMLSLAIINVASAVAMIAIGLRGTPLEPSKRAAMGPLLHANAVKWALGIAYAAYSFAVVYTVDRSCWTTPLLRLVKGTLWGSVGIYTMIFSLFFLAANALADYDPQKRWQIRLKKLSHRLGCYSTLTQAGAGQEATGETPLEELSAWFARFFGHIDLEKSDVLVGLALVEIMQVHQRKEAIAVRLCEQGALPKSQLPSPRLLEQRGSSATPAAHEGGGRWAGGVESSQGSSAAAEGPKAEAGEKPAACEAAVDLDSLFHQWLRNVSEGTAECLTPSHWGARLAPHLTPRQSAEIYTGCRDYASLEQLLTVQRVAKYAIAAYGVPLTRAQRLRSTAPVLARALPPVRQQLLAGGPAHVRAYAAALQIASIAPQDFVHLCWENEALGLTPYMISLHRPTRTVVLAVRGTNSMEDLLTDLIDRPVDVTDWVPAELRQRHPDCAANVFAHMGMWSAAKAVLQDLNQHQILPILLTGEPLSGDEQQRQHAWHAPDDRQRRWQARQLERRSLDAGLAEKRKGRRRGRHLQEVWQYFQPSGWTRDNDDWGLYTGDSGVLEAAGSLPVGIGLNRVSAQAAVAVELREWAQPEQPGPADGTAGQPGADSEGSKRSSKHAAAPPVAQRLTPTDYVRVLRERGLDCRGWRLVVTGHSLGAAVAALVGMQLRDALPATTATEVFAFNPPGGMTTPNLADALGDLVTSVVVGKDTISRLGTVTFGRLLDQTVVALARTRLPKALTLLGLGSPKLRDCPLDDVFHPLGEIPPEALAMVRAYFESKLRFSELLVPMVPPGRILLLRRLKEDDEAFARRAVLRRRQASEPDSAAARWRQRRQARPAAPSMAGCPSCTSTLVMWDAVWVRPEQIAAEGILLSSTQASDHMTSTLTFVLDHLTGQETLQAAPEALGERQRQQAEQAEQEEAIKEKEESREQVVRQQLEELEELEAEAAERRLQQAGDEEAPQA